jgi:hypothetical protein
MKVVEEVDWCNGLNWHIIHAIQIAALNEPFQHIFPSSIFYGRYYFRATSELQSEYRGLPTTQKLWRYLS